MVDSNSDHPHAPRPAAGSNSSMVDSNGGNRPPDQGHKEFKFLYGR